MDSVFPSSAVNETTALPPNAAQPVRIPANIFEMWQAQAEAWKQRFMHPLFSSPVVARVASQYENGAERFARSAKTLFFMWKTLTRDTEDHKPWSINFLEAPPGQATGYIISLRSHAVTFVQNPAQDVGDMVEEVAYVLKSLSQQDAVECWARANGMPTDCGWGQFIEDATLTAARGNGPNLTKPLYTLAPEADHILFEVLRRRDSKTFSALLRIPVEQEFAVDLAEERLKYSTTTGAAKKSERLPTIIDQNYVNTRFAAETGDVGADLLGQVGYIQKLHRYFYQRKEPNPKIRKFKPTPILAMLDFMEPMWNLLQLNFSPAIVKGIVSPLHTEVGEQLLQACRSAMRGLPQGYQRATEDKTGRTWGELFPRKKPSARAGLLRDMFLDIDAPERGWRIDFLNFLEVGEENLAKGVRNIPNLHRVLEMTRRAEKILKLTPETMLPVEAHSETLIAPEDHAYPKMSSFPGTIGPRGEASKPPAEAGPSKPTSNDQGGFYAPWIAALD